MKVHLNQIPPEGIHFEGEDPASILELNGPDVSPITPVRYTLDVGTSGGGVFATGHIAVDLDMACVSCLEHFVFPLEIDDFACQVELTGSEEIDLTDALKEDILLALPPHPRCNWDGRNKCLGVQRPAPAEPDGRESQPDTWGALDKLKIK